MKKNVKLAGISVETGGKEGRIGLPIEGIGGRFAVVPSRRWQDQDLGR
ncbi:MAG: hypothetical protein JSV16_07715 [Candidatus Hydrogenedentota bacterium]|nr:MAG: hypothetical protein JSV16_07715 [Candidatus Hydrogenedentota bacterium]